MEKKGILLPCPCCGELNAGISLDLYDPLGPGSFHCCDCDAMFGAELLMNVIARWKDILEWVDRIPTGKAVS